MNLIVISQPKDPSRSLSGALSMQLASRLGGATEVIKVYETSRGYFNYEFNEEWIHLIKKADRLILPVPMWNFTIPAALKDFIDKITKQKEAWDIDEKGHFIGLLRDRPLYIIMTSGGEYPEGSPLDFAVPYLKAIFSFMGIRHIKDFRVGGVSDSEKLIADKEFFQRKVKEMFKTFDVK